FSGEKAPEKVDIDNAMRTNLSGDKAKGLIQQTRALINLYNPPKWGPETLARLMGDSIKEVLLDRHKRIEQTMPELQENRESREELQKNLETFPLLKVQAQRYMDHPELAKQNPTKPSEFIRAIVSDPLIYARTYAEMHRQIQSGQWVSELGPAPTPPKEGAPRKEVEQYQHDKRVYEQQVGREHERFMKEAIRIRGIERDILSSQLGKFEVLDEMQQTIEEYRNIDLKTLRDDPEKMEAFGRKLDELRQKGQQMWEYCFDVINDRKRNMQITDAEATDIIWAVSASWCDVDAMLNTLELEAGRVQSDIGRLLEAPKLESSNQTLRETDTNLRHALEDSLKALESGDRRKMERTSDELKRQLVSAFDTAFPLLTGEDEPQARQLLDLISRATRVGVELDRTPQLRDRRDVGIEGWDKLVKDNEDRLYISRVESQLNKVAPPQDIKIDVDRPDWVTDSLYGLVAPFPALEFYVSQLKVGPNDNLIRGSQSIGKLFEGTVLNPIRQRMWTEVQNDKSVKQPDKNQVFRQREEPLSKRWDEKIAPGLSFFDDYKPLPPPPEKLDRKSIEEYGQTLTQYIETMTRAYEELLVTSTELKSLEDQTKDEQQKQQLFNANMVMTGAISIISEQVGVARKRLESLV
ncbi:MAG TPA: hypothetical protein VEC60_08755, partial [Reyranella sp.]|nr:hypothetical protein [Reyranella sp.]